MDNGGVDVMKAENSAKRLLVLDDENDVAATICMMAATVGYATDHVDKAEGFFQKIVSWQPTHVAVDLQLGDSDGVEILHQLAQMKCSSYVIIISGLGGRILASAAQAALENGLMLVGTLSKPFSSVELTALLVTDVPEVFHGITYSPTIGPLDISKDELVDALKNEEFITHFQPKISCSTGELLGFESLARWPQKNSVMTPPDVFVGLAEEAGLIHELTRQIYDYALANLPKQVRQYRLKLALNLSPNNLSDATFPRWLFEKCQEHNLAPTQVILELTETASMSNPLALLESLTQFRIRGFHLSIDDFGVGYSSLVQLARLPFSELKIDQSFVKNLTKSTESQKIVMAVVGLGRSLGLNVVAEGVEDGDALSFLREIDCDEAQGYFIAKPMERSTADLWSSVAMRSIKT